MSENNSAVARRHLIVVDENVIRVELDRCLPAGEPADLFASARCLQKLSPGNAARFERVVEVADFSAHALSRLIAANFDPAELAGLQLVTNDECVEVVLAALRARFGLAGDGAERARLMSDKLRMKSALRGVEGVRCPDFVGFCPERYAAEGEAYLRALTEQVGLPLVIKPTDGTSGRGVVVCERFEALRAWARVNGQHRNYELESFVAGVLYPVDSIVRGGEVIYVNAGEGAWPCLDYAAGRNMVVRVVPEDAPIHARLCAFNQRVVAALQPPDGALHMEVFERGDGELVFVEASARPGGGDLVWIYATHDGVDIEEAHFRLRSGAGFELQPREGPRTHAAFCVYPRRRGRVTELKVPALRSRFELRWAIAVGDSLADATDLASPAAGSLRLWSDSREDIAADFALLRDFVPFSVDVRSPRLIGYACGIGSEHATSREGPAALQDFLADIGSAWRWQSIVGHPDALAQLRGHAAGAAVAQVCEQLARETRTATLAGHFPIVIGGDHSSGVGTWTGVARALRERTPAREGRLGLLWFDAHLDSHTPATSPSGYCHGMPLAALLGHASPHLAALVDGAVLAPEDLILIGARNYEAEERSFLADHGVRVYFMDEVVARGLPAVVEEAVASMAGRVEHLGISVDLDGLDPRFAPAVGTPVEGGLDAAELLEALRGLARDPRVVGLEIAEFNPCLDVEHRTRDLLVELVAIFAGDRGSP